MKIRILQLVILVGIFINTNVIAQQCGTPTTGSNQDFFLSKNGITGDDSICINVSFHIVRQSNGSGGFNSSNIDLIVEDLNEYYNPFDIYINKQKVDFIDNSTYYNLTDNEINSLISINNSSNSINFYLVNSAPYAGRAQAILSKNLVVYNSYALSPTSAHELGHCLNLWHTHHGLGCNDLGGCAEAIDGSNSATCGDFVTDTPADPCVSGQVNGNCQYTGGGGYNPDPTNIMSYGGSCRNHFTSGQAQRMRNTILGSSLLQQVITCCFDPKISGHKTICSGSETTYSLSNNCDSVTWNVSSNLTILSQNQDSVTVEPINSLTNGEGYIEAILPDQTIRKDIWIDKPTLSTKFNCFTNPNHPMCQTLCKTNYYHPDNTIVLNVKGETEWESTQTGTFSWYVGDNKLYIQPYQTGTISLTLRAKNDCGTSSPLFFQFNVTDCGKMYQVYLNPSDNVVYINLVDNSSENTFTTSATTITGELYDFTGNLTTTITLVNNQGSIPVQNLNQGIYILKLYLNNSIETHQIIVE